MTHPMTKMALLSGLALAAMTNPTVAYAQADTGAAEGGDIIVTARRTEERLQDVPISIAVISQQDIRDKNIVQASDLAIYTPSLTVNQRFGPETSAFAIRGFLQEANTAPSVGVYFAEVTTPRSLGLTAAGSNLAIGSFMDLESTQILKGPQGTLFGRNTTGGAILLVPKRPTAKFEGYVEGSAGDYGMLRGQAMVNIPLSDNVRVRLDVDRMKRDGYIHNRSGIGPTDYDDSNYLYLRGSILANLTPNLENYFVAHYSHSNTHGFASRIIDCNPANFLTGGFACAQLARMNAAGYGPLDTEVPVANPYFKIDQFQLIDHLTWQVSDNLKIKNIASYSKITSDFNYSLAGENFILPGGPPFQTTVITQAPGLHSNDQWTFTDELQLQGKTADNRLNWQAGGYIEVSKSPQLNAGLTNVFLRCTSIQSLQCTDFYGPLFGGIPVGSISNAAQKTTFIDKALYAQASYDFTDKLSMTAGIRYTWDKITAINEATRYLYFPPLTSPTGLNPIRICNDSLTFGFKIVTSNDQCFRQIDTSSSAPTWSVDLDYKPTKDLMVYAKYSRGYRAGGIAVLNLGLEVWQPEKLDAYEIGLKASFHGAVRGYFNIAGFYNDFTNQQIVATTISKATGVAQGNAILNAGKSRIQGIEVDSAVTLFNSLDLSLGYTFLDTKIVQLTIPVSPIYNFQVFEQPGDPLPQVPRNRLNLSARYTLPLDSSIGKITFGATFIHTDKQLSNHPVGGIVDNLPASDQVNLNVNWHKVLGSPVDAAFFVTNVTNALIDVVHGSEFGTLGYDSVQYAPPRMWGFRLRYSFGQ